MTTEDTRTRETPLHGPGTVFPAVARLEETFRLIHRERMRDIPILNPALAVEAVGFVPWQERLLGVLVTPWFMNLMLLPREGDDWSDLEVVQKVLWSVPAGQLEFIVGREANIGTYQSCSLLSPVLEIADQETARRLAAEVMTEMLRPAAADQDDDASQTNAGTTATENNPVSRRDLLSGTFRRR